MTPMSNEERRYLRELARKQAEYAALPVMQERKRQWRDLNDGRPTKPPVVVETWTFDRDFMPPEIFRCETPEARRIEAQLLRPIRVHELINDDQVVPDTFDIQWHLHIDHFGVPVPRQTIADAQGYETGYEDAHPIADLERDFEKLKPAQCAVDRAATQQWRAYVEDALGDILPVRLASNVPGDRMLTQAVVRLMGMQAFFFAMCDCPDKVHELMAYLRDNALRVMRWAEAEGVLCLNNENDVSFGSSYNFTEQLPAPDYDGSEFCFPYYRDVCEPLGRVYYGCCEPTHPFWDDIQNLPHLSKVSISRWCDQAFMGEALQGRNVIFSRKPDPNFLGVSVQLDEAGWAAHISETLWAARDVPLEIIVRDVYTVHGDLSKPRRAVEIARLQIERHFKA